MRYLDEMEGEKRITVNMLTSSVRISSFFCFLGMLNKQPNTIYNRAKSLSMVTILIAFLISQFFRYCLQYKSFQKMSNCVLSVQEQLRDIKKIYKKLNYIHLANDVNAENERQNGRLLTVHITFV